jgi:hypothetical protein
MKCRWPAILLASVAIVLLCVTGSHLLRVSARSAPAPRSRAPQGASAVTRPAPTPTPEGPEAAAESDPALQRTATFGPGQAGSARRKHATLAEAAEPPAGPEIGPGLTPFTVLENMRGVFHQYASRFGGNPVGTNAEITGALNGNNPGHVVFLEPEAGMRTNNQGELIDNWGTPFFFHQLSGTTMEIHSAGPDRKMWTADDLVLQ